jgi:hypothetical protein
MIESTPRDTICLNWPEMVGCSGARLERWANTLADAGILRDDVFSANLDQWGRIGTPPETHEEEILDEWAMLQTALAGLVAVRSQVLELRSTGFVGADDGRLSALVDGWCADGTRGFALWAGPTLPLPITAFLVGAIGAPATTRASQLARWARVREYVEVIRKYLPSLVRVTLDQHLEALAVRTPGRFGLRWTPHSNKAIVSLEVTEKMDDGTDRAVDLSSLDPDTGVITEDANQPTILPEDVLKVARQARGRQYQVARKVAAEFADPTRVIPEGTDADAWFDLSEYAARVIGFERVVRHNPPLVFQSSGVGWYDKSEAKGPFLRLVFSGPETEQRTEISVAQPHDAQHLLDDTTAALVQMAAHPEEPVAVTFDGLMIRPAPALRDTLGRALTLYRERLVHDAEEPAQNRTERLGRFAAVIDEREASATFDRDGLVIDESRVPWQELAKRLEPGVNLKPHQRRGIAWLWHHWQAGEPGVLLADDMGLGKTLQVAAFLALRLVDSQGKPTLIAAPTILLSNWREELDRFFRPGVFTRVLVLHDEELRMLRRGRNELDIDQIGRASLVLTNYETLAAHQISLLRVDFSTIVFDEVQAIKNETTLRARAARGLKREFAIAMTGTPVENRLSDLWAICDALHPTADRRAFGSRPSFERDYEDSGAEGISAVRRKLCFPSPTSIVLRREKAEALRDLPVKQYRSVPVPMTSQQFELERVIAREMRQHGPLGILDRLRKLYQHPALLDATDGEIDVERAVEESPKTAATISILREVAAKGEKAIVFTQWAHMQDLLVTLLKSHLGLSRVNIINGNPQRRRCAQQIIADFSAKPGFDVLVLSPLAAGVGLTITAANHVIHYGRWWNPAKEDQATDRAHRIGQTRTVYVYYPILHHPGNPDGGFDIKLHQLMERKRAVARDFLAPAEDASLGKEIESILEAPEGYKP